MSTPAKPDLREQRRIRELSAMVTRTLADDAHVHIRQQLFSKPIVPWSLWLLTCIYIK